MQASKKYPEELRQRAQRMVAEALSEDSSLSLSLSMTGAVKRIGPRVGVVPETLRGWIRQDGSDFHVVVQERDELFPGVLPEPDDRPVLFAPLVCQLVQSRPRSAGIGGRGGPALDVVLVPLCCLSSSGGGFL